MRPPCRIEEIEGKMQKCIKSKKKAKSGPGGEITMWCPRVREFEGWMVQRLS
jgi:hypothetical protein